MKLKTTPVVVLCLGDADRGDESLGPCCADRLDTLGVPARALRGDAHSLLDAWHGARHAIIVDTRKTKAGRPGMMHKVTRLATSVGSADLLGFRHQQNIHEALRLGRELNALPEHLTLMAVEAEGFEWGAAPSVSVAGAIETLCEEVASIVGHHHGVSVAH